MKYLMLVCTDPGYQPGQDEGARPSTWLRSIRWHGQAWSSCAHSGPMVRT